ncbi:MAG: N-6 DNA methylase [Ktedonobacteraceae bacterium]|nr:N-6 DNA methylase [Ktedonobacteraceae bacterium]
MVSSVTDKKANGAHFTPSQLARFVARRVMNAIQLDSMKTIHVLDPACGDGELLLAFAEVLPSLLSEKVVFIGVDSDSTSLVRARERLKDRSIFNFELIQADYLELARKKFAQPGLFERELFHELMDKSVDVIIANPPYVRTQVLGAKKAQELAAVFGLKGRVDLYQAFLVAMTRHLSTGGILGVITSNRFLSTQGGASTREFLANEYDIIELFDLGDTKLFEAAVLPAILIGEKRPGAVKNGHKESPGRGRFVRIYEQKQENKTISPYIRQLDSIYTVLEAASDGYYRVAGQHYRVSTGILSLPLSADKPWSMVTSDEACWLEVIHAHTMLRIKDVANVRVGVKTTADEVFIRSNWEQLTGIPKPEDLLLRPLLSQDEAARWIVKNAKISRRILYTHTIKNGKRVPIDLSEYPHAAAYLEYHRSRLERRTYVLEAKRNWYEIWVPQNPALWTQPKIVFPDISPQPRFFFDESGCIVDGNCYWITVDRNRSLDLLFLIAGIANSRLMTHYHDLMFNNKLYAGRRRYLTQYVENYPLPDPSLPSCREIVTIVRDLVYSSLSEKAKEQKERDIEILVAQAFGVEPV